MSGFTKVAKELLETHGIIGDYFAHQYNGFEIVEDVRSNFNNFKDVIMGKSFDNEEVCTAAVHEIIEWRSN